MENFGENNWYDFNNRFEILERTIDTVTLKQIVNSARFQYATNFGSSDIFYYRVEMKSSLNGGGLASQAAMLTSYSNSPDSEVLSYRGRFIYGLASIQASGVGSITTLKDPIVINLTETFGAGKEPSKEVMDAIVEEYGYFEELIINRDFIHEFELKQMKEAILRLGGTI